MKRISILGLCLLLLGSCSESAGLQAGAPTAFSIEVVDMDGLQRELDSRKGSAYLLNFWAIWCAPCVAELPELVEVGEEYRERGGSVLGVSYDLMVAGADSAAIEQNMQEFFQRRGVNLPTLVFDGDDYEGINALFDLPGEVPVTLAIDSSGAIVDRQHGSADRTRFAAMMEKALGL